MPKCGNCHNHHDSVADIRKCYSGTQEEELATTKQITFIESLVEERNIEGLRKVVPAIKESLESFQTGGKISKADASRLINGLLGCDPKPPAETLADMLPVGKYALVADDGHVFFVKVERPSTGRWAGFTFANLLLGAPGNWRQEKVGREQGQKWLADIRKDPTAAAQLFGDKTKTCGNCGSPLSKLQSRAAGYGARCAEKHGWYYPTKAEAAIMCNERGLEPLTGEEVTQLELVAEGDLAAEEEQAAANADAWATEPGLEPEWTI